MLVRARWELGAHGGATPPTPAVQSVGCKTPKHFSIKQRLYDTEPFSFKATVAWSRNILVQSNGCMTLKRFSPEQRLQDTEIFSVQSKGCKIQASETSLIQNNASKTPNSNCLSLKQIFCRLQAQSNSRTTSKFCWDMGEELYNFGPIDFTQLKLLSSVNIRKCWRIKTRSWIVGIF